ncbi:hypothetical protein ACIG47_11025 [Promicromonospora sp. NPDC052451]|uniref:hypothetical protein n=1 Tax=unclassified Promicromonospora TaxID=2647929 RepID=UPI0037C7897D
MTSSNSVAEPAPVAEAAHEPAPETAGTTPVTPMPFELLPVGEAFGVCDLDGVCS